MSLTQQRARASQAVEVQEKRFGYFPHVFRWRGTRYQVDAVERCWNATRDAPHLCFRVRCNQAVFELYQNLRDNTWRLVPIRA